ncbi:MULTISPECIES: METTL5 family protein [Thermococcus]|uniref:Methyltransferase-like protein 5 n=1 Tax=Thermococcus barossii TaxID=54077 RepID=A0A2Z2ME91_9EURY|nr:MULTISPECIES: METTL5 family protein [Thermococcus]ASJ03903.1 DNA methylase [Thermococcus barossii]NJE77203.1 DNA methylase [Thermococcus sp. ES12]
MKKKHLAMALSRLEGFRNPKPELEQYRTPGDVAAELLWLAHSMGDIAGRVVADLGAGTGVLTVGACLLGAERVHAVEVDGEAVDILRANVERLALTDCVEIHRTHVTDFSVRVDTVVMNPPFGSQNRHADRPFLLKAFEVSDVVYSIHLAKPEVRRFIESFVKDSGFSITHRVTLPFEIPAQFFFHRKRLERISVDVYRFQRM